jgi:hypothetical protein
MMNNDFLFRLINPKQKSALVEVFCYNSIFNLLIMPEDARWGVS